MKLVTHYSTDCSSWEAGSGLGVLGHARLHSDGDWEGKKGEGRRRKESLKIFFKMCGVCVCVLTK